MPEDPESTAAAEVAIRTLLRSLHAWERAGGADDAGNVADKSLGEDIARVAEIRRQLLELGARFHHTPQGYVLDSIVSGPGAEGPPDTASQAEP